MEQLKLTTTEAILYSLLFNAGIGLFLGLIPLILGFVKKERSYAVFGFLGSVIGGAILGVFLSIPIAAVFTWLILRRPKNAATDVVIMNERPINVKVEDSENR